MRILFISSGLSSNYGGSAVSESSLAHSLSKKHHLDILCERKRLDPKFAKEMGLNRVIEFSTLDAWVAHSNDSHWINRIIQEADYIHINGHWRANTFLFAKLAMKFQIPYVLHPRGMSLVGHHNIFLKKIYNEIMGNYIFENATSVIALSHFETRHFSSYSVAKEKIHVIPNGIAIPNIIREKTKIQSPYFLYLGRIEHRKNLLFLLQAFARFSKNTPEYLLKLRGPVEKSYNELVKIKIQSLSLQSKVELLPPLYDESKWDEISASQAVIYPSIEEAFGRVPFEALASKTFTIVPRQSGSAEYLYNLIPDCIFDLNNEDSLVKTLLAVAKKDKSCRELDQAHAWVKKELDWNKISELVLDLYTHSAA